MSAEIGDPRLESILAEAARTFQDAMSSFEDSPRRLIQFAGIDLRVDVRRHLVATNADEYNWNGATVDSSTEIGRAFLSLFAGDERYLNAATFCSVLADASRTVPRSNISETAVALVVNLVVIEPLLHPEREWTIWAAFARELALSRPYANIYNELPFDAPETSELWSQLETQLRALADSFDAADRWSYVRHHVTREIRRAIG